MAEEREGARNPRSEAAVESLRHVFERIWPVDRKPVFGGLVRAIDEFDRRQRRRRKRSDAANQSD